MGSEGRVVVFDFGARWEGRLVRNGFDFEIFVVVQEIEADLLFSADRFNRALDAGRETVQLTHDVRKEGDWGFEDVFDAEAHGLVEEEFHLEEAELLVDELVDEADFGWSDGFELFEIVGDDRQGDVVVVDEAIEVCE